MWSSKAIHAVLPTLLIAACASSGDAARSLSSEKEDPVFKIESTAEAGVFHAFLRNDRSLFSRELYESFTGLLKAYCGTGVVMLEDIVFLISHEQVPQPAIENRFRCEASRP